MSERLDEPEDEALRRLLQSDAVEPDAALDARILAAAREASPSVPRRRWRYPVGVGAAASALLAIALLLQTPETADTIEGIKPGRLREDMLSKAERPVAKPATSSPEMQPSAADSRQLVLEAPAVEATTRFTVPPARALADAVVPAPPEPTAGALMIRPQERAIAPTAATESAMPTAPHAEIDQPIDTADANAGQLRTTRALERTSSAAAPSPTKCPAGANSLEGEGLRLCIADDHIEVWDASPSGCREPLSLERVAGTVSLQSTDAAVTILIDDQARWRVRCSAGQWQVEARL